VDIEAIPLRVFLKWSAFAVVAFIAFVILAASVAGLCLTVFAFAHLVIFRPAPHLYVSDAELYAWLARG
jgi:hypothetical protein